mgnify:FL=1
MPHDTMPPSNEDGRPRRAAAAAAPEEDHDGEEEQKHFHARNKTIDLKRDDAYVCVRIAMEKRDDKKSGTNNDQKRENNDDATKASSSALPRITETSFLEIVENALLIMRGSVGGRIEKHLVHFETELMFASKKSAFGAMRVKRKDVETLVSAVRGYDALYKQSENNDDIGLMVRVVHVANSLLDVVGLDRERDTVETLLYGGKALPKTTKKKNTLTST